MLWSKNESRDYYLPTVLYVLGDDATHYCEKEQK